MEQKLFYKSRVSPFRDRNEFEEIYDLLFSSTIDREKKQNAFNAMAIWKIRLANYTPTGVLCTMEILEAIIHDMAAPKTSEFDVVVSYSNAITRYLNFLTSLNHDASENAENMKAVAKSIGVPDYLVNLRINISHTTQYPSLKVLRRAAKHCLELIKRKYWDVEKAHIREIQLDAIRQSTVEKKLPKTVKKRQDNLSKSQQLLDLQLGIYDFVVELIQKYEVKKHKDLYKHVQLPAAQLESLQKYFYNKTKSNIFTTYENIIAKDIEESLQMCNDDGEYVTEAIFKKCGFFKEIAVKEHPHSLASVYQKLFEVLHKHNCLPKFIESLFEACETKKKPFAELYWLQVTINSLLKHVQATPESGNYVLLSNDVPPVEFSPEFLKERLFNVNELTRKAVLSCFKLMKPETNQSMIEQLVKIYKDSPEPGTPTDDKVYTVCDLVEKLPATNGQETEPQAKETVIGLLGRKRKYGVWQSFDDSSIDWKKMSLGCEVSM